MVTCLLEVHPRQPQDTHKNTHAQHLQRLSHPPLCERTVRKDRNKTIQREHQSCAQAYPNFGLHPQKTKRWDIQRCQHRSRVQSQMQGLRQSLRRTDQQGPEDKDERTQKGHLPWGPELPFSQTCVGSRPHV